MKGKKYFDRFLVVFAMWVMLSFFGSTLKIMDRNKYSDRYGSKCGGAHIEQDSCGRTYPIDYILYNNLFCEIGDL